MIGDLEQRYELFDVGALFAATLTGHTSLTHEMSSVGTVARKLEIPVVIGERIQAGIGRRNGIARSFGIQHVQNQTRVARQHDIRKEILWRELGFF